MTLTRTEGTYEAGYEAGFKAGKAEAECDGVECYGYGKGYDAGYEEAIADAASLHGMISAAGFDALETVEVRWDAALKRWIFRQAGLERIVSEGEI